MTTRVPVTAAAYQYQAAATTLTTSSTSTRPSSPSADQTLSGALAQPAGLTVESQMIFLDCPAYLDEHGAQRCGLPAEVKDWFTMCSTSGPVECVKIRCPSGHWFHAPLEFLTWNNAEGPGAGRLKTAGKVPARSRDQGVPASG
jgi:hypothetical protein